MFGRLPRWLGAGAVLLWWTPGAMAHEPAISYLALRVENSRIHGQVDIALRDLEQAVGLDANEDGRITWGELRARHDDIDAYVVTRLAIRSGGRACPVRP